MTTLQSPEVQEMLARMVEGGRRYAVIEASSHGLALNRVDECEFDIALFTTLSSDHLDFHGDPAGYIAAKGRLFEMLDESVEKGVPKTAVLNADDPVSTTLRARTRARAVTYAIDAAADLRAESLHLEALASSFDLVGRLASCPSACRCPAATTSTMPSPRAPSRSRSALLRKPYPTASLPSTASPAARR